jgi:hypothetical protein
VSLLVSLPHPCTTHQVGRDPLHGTIGQKPTTLDNDPRAPDVGLQVNTLRVLTDWESTSSYDNFQGWTCKDVDWSDHSEQLLQRLCREAATWDKCEETDWWEAKGGGRKDGHKNVRVGDRQVGCRRSWAVGDHDGGRQGPWSQQNHQKQQQQHPLSLSLRFYRLSSPDVRSPPPPKAPWDRSFADKKIPGQITRNTTIIPGPFGTFFLEPCCSTCLYLFTYHSGTGVEYFRTGPRSGIGSVLTSFVGRSVVVVGRFLRFDVSNPGFQVRECSVGPL